MTGEPRPAHSPLGGSGAFRWMKCPGSPGMSEGIVDEDSEYAGLGSAAHALAELCLRESKEPWQFMNLWVHEGDIVSARDNDECVELAREGAFLIDRDMVNAVQFYISTIYGWHPASGGGQQWVEKRFHCPSIHDLFYGAADYVFLLRRVLDVWDYKHGVGIVVEPEDNPQLMYYACGVLEQMDAWDKVDVVRLHIVQPRAWHTGGRHRHWETTTEHLVEWLEDRCVPAMELAMVSRDTIAGMHCRFCPARQAQCPSLMEAMAEYMRLVIMADRRGAEALTPEQLGTLINLHELGKIVAKAAYRTAYGRLASGIEVPLLKLVKSRTNRKFKENAEEAAIEKFGKDAMTTPELKSPAQIDEMPEGKAFTARWAYKPEGGTTVATAEDPRRAIKRGARSLFKPVEK